MRVFVNGTFDIIHSGHLKLFNKAREIAGPDGFVLVAIDSDRRVKELKGSARPVHNQSFRQELLNSIKQINFVIIFDSDEDLTKAIQHYSPHYMVKGSDYKDKPILGREFCKEIVFVETTDDSTTKTIKRIANR